VNIRESRAIGMMMAVSLLFLAGCGGSGPDSNGNNKGVLNLSVSDAAIDAEKVCIKFDGVQLKKADESALIDLDFDDPVVINLLANQGAVSETLVSTEVDAGTYKWVRLKVDAITGNGAGVGDSNFDNPVCTDTENGSYLLTNVSELFNIWIPSGDETGLKLIKDIVIPVNSSGNYTAEWDLGMSFVGPPGLGTGEAIMKPVVKLVANNEVGTLNGTVASEFFVAQEGQEVATCPAEPEFAPMVYVFDDDGNSEIAINSDGSEGTRDPVASGLVAQDMDAVDMPYVYEIGFLLAGNYEVALSCDGQATFNPENGKVAPIAVGNVTVIDFTTDDLPPPPAE